MTSPPNEFITPEMWELWLDRPNKTWQLGGIYANKAHYHNTVNANLEHWPNSYSIKLPLDLVSYNRNYARAIDLSMSATEMVKWTTRMRDSALNPQDTRLDAVKEFYGTLDSKTVFGLSKDVIHGGWEHSTANKSHLTHGHTSIFTAFVRNWDMLSPLLSVWAGESFEEWSISNMNLPKQGDKGQTVLFWQYVHNRVRETVKPPSPQIKIDGDYGPATAAAVADFWKKKGGSGTFNGSFITGWLGMQYMEALASVNQAPPSPINDSVIKAAVNDWLTAHLGKDLSISGNLTGKITLP